MRLRECHRESELSYLLDTGDGQYAEGRMCAEVAEEIVSRAETRELGGAKGFELVVNGRMLFPLSAFELEEGEDVERSRRGRRRRATGRSEGM